MKDKNSHLKYLLLKRCEMELDKKNYSNANSVAFNLFWLYPEDQNAREGLIRTYISKAKQLINDKQLQDAEKIVISALEFESENPLILSILEEIQQKKQNDLTQKQHKLSSKSIKATAYQFVKKFYPGELDIFELAWRVFKDIKAQDFVQETVSGALGIVGKQELSDVITPKLIILLTALGKENFEALDEGEIKNILTETGRKIGCSQELLNQVKEFVLQMRLKT